MISIQETQAFHGRNCYSTPFQALNIEAQIRVLVDALGRQHLHRPKVVSTKTCSERHLFALLVFRQLGEGGFKPRSVLGLSSTHIAYLAKRWEQEKLSPPTIQTRFSFLRWLTCAIGKAGMVRDPSTYGVPESVYARNLTAQRDKSWSAKNRPSEQQDRASGTSISRPAPRHAANLSSIGRSL